MSSFSVLSPMTRKLIDLLNEEKIKVSKSIETDTYKYSFYNNGRLNEVHLLPNEHIALQTAWLHLVQVDVTLKAAINLPKEC